MQILPKTNVVNIWTRIFYENQTLKYEISIQLENGTSSIFSVFINYEEYRTALAELVRAKDNGNYVDLGAKVQST